MSLLFSVVAILQLLLFLAIFWILAVYDESAVVFTLVSNECPGMSVTEKLAATAQIAWLTGFVA